MLRFLPLLLLPAVAVSASAELPEPMVLVQERSVVQQHQRMVGNVRARARREGVVRNVPQLYIYHADRSEAYHMDGHRDRFTREVELTLDRFRTARSMVALDTLLSRTRTTEDETPTLDSLPPADVTIVVYRRAECPECDRVEADLADWLAENDHLEALLIRVAIDGRLPESSIPRTPGDAEG